MSHRYAQEEKFKNITLRLEELPNMHASTVLRAPADRDHYRPSTPISRSKYDQNISIDRPSNADRANFNIEIRTSQPTHIRTHSIGSPNAVSQLRQEESVSECEEEELRRRLEEKEEIISELKNIIKLSNENNSRTKTKNLVDHSPNRHDEELRELRHNVKVLTIENNALSGYIDKLKQQLASHPDHHQDESEDRDEQGRQGREGREGEVRALQEENRRLREAVAEKEEMYERKIDEFILSHKSLASECKRLEHLKEAADCENERLALMMRDLEETQRRSHQDDRMGKTMTAERTSIAKIKDQYAQSIQQVRENIQIQVDNLFHNFRLALADIDRRVGALERRLLRAEEEVRRAAEGETRGRKSEIYIEEGSDMGSEGSTRKNVVLRSAVASRFLEDAHQDELVRPLHDEIARLRDTIAEMELQMSSRSEYYTFRDQENEAETERERELLHEMGKLRQEIDRLETAYRDEKNALEDEREAREERIADLTAALRDLQHKYDDSLQQMKQLVDRARTNEELAEEVVALRAEAQGLREQSAESSRRVEQYRRLCQLLQAESKENSASLELFSSMKQQLCGIRERSHADRLRLAATDNQNKEVLAANRELKDKLDHALANSLKLAHEHQQLQELHRQAQLERQELAHRADYNQKLVQILEGEIAAKKDMEETLLNEKQGLEKQLVGYLSLFNKLTFEEQPQRRQEEELPIEDLLSKLSRIEASFHELHSSKRDLLSRLASDCRDDLSSVHRA